MFPKFPSDKSSVAEIIIRSMEFSFPHPPLPRREQARHENDNI